TETRGQLVGEGGEDGKDTERTCAMAVMRQRRAETSRRPEPETPAKASALGALGPSLCKEDEDTSKGIPVLSTKLTS
ncbi:hypothetical protein P7K49_014972, partial [Saguinus oedipus]